MLMNVPLLMEDVTRCVVTLSDHLNVPVALDMY